MNVAVSKRAVMELLKCEITDEQFEEALEYAKKKQNYIFLKEARAVILEEWYLTKLTEEYVRSLAFSRYTMELCRTLNDMEKEHQAHKNLGAPKIVNHIVTVSV